MKQGGATLVELLVSLALISVVVLAAAALLTQSARVFAAASRTGDDPNRMFAGVRLRRDVHSAQAIAFASWAWTGTTLSLLQADGGHLEYRLEGSRLLRTDFGPDGTPIDRRVIARKLLSWRWRSVNPQLVEAELTYSEGVDPSLASGFNDPARLARTSVRRQALVFALRGGGSW